MRVPSPGSLRWRLWSIISAMPSRAKGAVEPFMRAVVANFGNEWEMTSADIDVALDALRGAPLRAAS